MFSYGSDITQSHNALELGLPHKWCSGDKDEYFCGKQALQKITQQGGPTRQLVGLEFQMHAQKPGPLYRPWTVLGASNEASYGKEVGSVSSVSFSPKLMTHLAIATLKIEEAQVGSTVLVQVPGKGPLPAVVRKLPFLP